MKTLRTSLQSQLPILSGNRMALRRHSPIQSACLLFVMMSAGMPAYGQQTASPGTPAEARASEENWLASQIRLFRAYPHLHRAYRQIDQNNMAGAQESLEVYLELDAQDMNARVSLLHVLFRQKKYTDMVSHAEMVLKREPEHIVAHLYRALGKQTAGHTEDAFASYTRVYQNPKASREDRIFAASSAADIALRQKRNSEALVALTLLQSLDSSFNVNYRRGLVLEALGNLDGAYESHQLALNRAENAEEKAEAHSALGYVLGKMGRTKEAIEHGNAVLKQNPGSAEWLRSLANLYYSAKDYVNAEILARRAVQTGKSAEDRQILANVLMAREKYGEAAEWYGPLANGNTDIELRYQAAMGLGYALGGSGNQTAARDAFALALTIRPGEEASKALELTTRNVDAMTAYASSGSSTGSSTGTSSAAGGGFAVDPSTLGAQYVQRGQPDKAIKILEQGLRTGRNPALRLQLAEVLAGSGDPDRAAREVARFEPRTLEQRRRVADVYARVGDAPKAIAYLTPAATTAVSRLQLGQYYLEAGQPEQALAALNAVVQHKSQPAERIAALRQAAYIEAQRGNEAEALRLFQQSLGQGDTTPQTHKEVAFLLSRLGRHGDAISQLSNLSPDAIGADVLLLTARSYSALKRPDDAVRYYEAATEAAAGLPTSEQAALYAELGHYYSEQGNYASAHDQWSHAAQLHDDPALQQSLAYAEEMLGRTGDAIARLTTLSAATVDQDQQVVMQDQLARLYDKQGDASNAAAAMERALAIGATPERHYQRALIAMKLNDGRVARNHLERATAASPDNADYAQQLAYLCKSQKDTPCAARMFENVVRIDPNRTEVFEDLAYTYTEGGDNDKAIEWFKRAIDKHLDQRQMQALVSYLQEPAGVNSQTGMPGAGSEEDRVYRLRQQVRDMSRRYQFNVYQSYRSNTNPGTSDITPGFQTGGLIPSQGGVEFLYQPPGIGYQDGRTFRTFARMLWSNRPDSLRINSDTLQGGVGVEYKPFREQNVYVSVERLIKVGDQSQNNWLARASWGYADGYGMKPGQASWNHTIVYADVGYLLQREKTKSVYAELRQGRSYNYNNKAMITPHVTVAGRGQRPDPADASYLEIGAGVALKAFFNETRYEAARSNTEFVVQYRKPVNNGRTGGWVMAAALQF